MFAAIAETERHRHHTDDHRRGRHEHGTQAPGTRLPRGTDGIAAFREILPGEGDDEHGIRGGHAKAHDRAHHRRNAERGRGEMQPPSGSGKRAGERGEDDEGIEPALEIDHEQQVDERDGHHEPDTEADEARAHRLRLAPQNDRAALRQCLLRLGDEWIDVVEYAGEIASAHSAEDVDHGPHVVVRIDWRTVRAPERGKVGEELAAVASRLVRGDWQGLEIGERIHAVFRRAHVHEVLDADAAIEPVAGLDLRAAAQAEEDRTRDVALAQAHLRGFRAIDVKGEAVQVPRLLHAHIHGAPHVSHLLREHSGHAAVFVQVASDDLNVERRGQSEVDRLRDDVRRQKVEDRAGKLLVQPQPQIADVALGRAMPFV